MNIHNLQKEKWQGIFKKKIIQNHDLLKKTVTTWITVFTIFYGIPMPTSFATPAPVTQDERQAYVRTILLEDAISPQTSTSQTTIPSGAAIQNPNPLSASITSGPIATSTSSSLQTDGNPTPEPQAHRASVIRVRPGESIQAAIDQAQAGDTVYIETGVYSQSLTLKRGVNLQGENPETTIINGNGRNEDVVISLGDNRIESLTIRGGVAFNGTPYSAIRVEGDNVTISNNIIKDNLNYAVYLRSGRNTLIEKNLFLNNYLAIQHPHAAVTGVVIQSNTLVNSRIGINLLSGVRPIIRNNIITGSTFASIYEFCWGQNPSRGFATVEGNIFYNNTERGSHYGSALPPSVENRTQGNVIADPKFVNTAQGNYRLQPGSPALGKGAYPDPIVPQGWTGAVSNVNFAYRIGTGEESGVLYLLDLKTNKEYLVWGFERAGTCDVSPDGQSVIYDGYGRTTSPIPPTDVIYIQSIPQLIADGGISRVSYVGEKIENLHFATGQGGVPVVFITTKEHVYEVETATQLWRSTWTRATSNPNFAFGIKTVPDGGAYGAISYLQLQDLRTGKVQTLASSVQFHQRFSPIYDVSPDGATVIYGTYFQETGNPFDFKTILQRIEHPTEKLVLKNIQIQSIAFESAGEIAVINGAIRVALSTLQPAVPEGWTRAVSNVNYVYRITNTNPGNPMAGNEVLQVQDLRTGLVRTVYEKPAAQEDLWNIPDVSPDGKYMVFATRTAGGGSKAYVCELAVSGSAREFVMTTNSWVPNAPANPYHFSGNEILIDMVNFVDMKAVGVYHINIATWQGVFWPALPPGWTRAASNPNFAFLFSSQYVGHYWTSSLKVQDLRTGAVQTLDNTYYPVGSISNVYDVSPDGQTVIYGTYRYPDIAQTIIRRLDGSGSSVVIQEGLRKIEFVNGILHVSTGISFAGTVIEERYVVQNGQATLENEVLVQLASGTSIDETNHLLILTELEGGRGYGRIAIYDTAGGTDHLRRVAVWGIGDGYPVSGESIPLQSVSLFNNQRIVSISVDKAAYYRDQRTMIVNVDTKQQLVLHGYASSVTYNGKFATYSLELAAENTARLGLPSHRIVTVNLETLEIVPAEVLGSAYNLAAITQLANQPVLNSGSGSAGGTANGTIQVTQASSSQFSMNYMLVDSDDFVFSYIGDGYFSNGVWTGTTQNLSSGLVLAASGTSGKQLRVEVIDRNGLRAVYYLSLTGLLQNYSVAFSPQYVPAGFDASHIAQIVFAADRTNMGGSGSVNVEIKGLLYIPELSSVPTPVSNLIVRSSDIHLISLGTKAESQTSLIPYGAEVRYDTAAPGVLNGFAGGGVTFIQPSVFSASATDMVLGVQATGTDRIKLEIQDLNRKSTSLILTGVKETQTNFSISLDLLRQMGLNVNLISQIIAIVESPNTQGTIRLCLSTMTDLLRPGTGTVSVFPGTDVAVMDQTNGGKLALTSKGVQMVTSFDRTSWSGVGFSFDNFATPETVETVNLLAVSPLRIGLKGTATQAKVEVIDKTGKKGVLYLLGISSTEQVYTLDPQALQAQGIDLTQIQQILIVVEQNKGNATGATLEVNIARDLRVLVPTVITSQPLTWPVLNMTHYSVGDSNETSIRGGIQFGFDTTPVPGVQHTVGAGMSFSKPYAVNANELVIGVSATFTLGLSKQLVLEIHDADGKKAKFAITNLKIAEQHYAISVEDLVSKGLDPTRLIQMTLLANEPGMRGNATFRIANQTDNIISEESTLSITALPGEITVMNQLGKNGTMEVTPHGVKAQFSRDATQGWSAIGLSFDNFGTPSTVETIDLSRISNWTFGLRSTIEMIKIEILDQKENKAIFFIQGVAGDSQKNFSIPQTWIKEFYPFVDLTKIQQILFVAPVLVPEGPQSLEVDFGRDLRTVIPALVTTHPVTELFKNPSDVSHISLGNSAESSVEATERGVKITFNTDAQGPLNGFAGGGINFKTAPALSNAQEIVVGVSSTVSRMKLEITDKTGKRVSFQLSGLTTEEQRFSLSIADLVSKGVNPNQIATMILIAEEPGLKGTAILQVRPEKLSMSAVVIGLVPELRSLSSLN